MATFSELKTMVATRITGSGINVNTNNYNAILEESINWAQREFCVVNWKFLHSHIDILTAPNQKQYPLFNTSEPTFYDFGKEDIVTISIDGLIEIMTKCHQSDIDTIGTTMSVGPPLFYSISEYQAQSGLGANVKSIFLGMPTSDSYYNVVVYYYKLLPELVGASDVSLISQIYRDEPLIEGAVWKFSQAINRDLGPSEFYRSMKTAQENLTFDGLPYPEKISQQVQNG